MEALHKIKIQLKQYRQAVLRHAFVGKLTAEWREAHKGELEPASVLLERIEKERGNGVKGEAQPPLDTLKSPRLPEGWAFTRLGSIIFPSDEKVDPTKTKKLPYIGLEHIEKDTGKLLDYGYSDDVTSTKSRFYSGDLLYGRLRPYLNKTYVAGFDGICSTDILVFPKQEQIPNKFIYFRLLCSDFVRYASRNVSGVQHPRVSYNTLSQFMILLPPFNEQNKIVEEIERHLSVAGQIGKAMEQSVIQADRLRQGILKKAFEGKLVSQNPADEPAETMLERIMVEKVTREAGSKSNTRQGRLI